MRNYIDILNETLSQTPLKEGQDNTPIALLRRVLNAWEMPHYGDPENQLENMSEVMDEVRAMLGIEDLSARSLNYRRGRNDAYRGAAFDPPTGRTSKDEYQAGWEQGRKERGL